jgi:lipopolysaccharide/colanic/teichoic acid biosynthesis glycosyltransferase
MITSFVKNNQDLSLQPSREFCDSEYGCYVEEYFHELLEFERKRSERSRRPFIVMTMDFTGIRKPMNRREAVKISSQTLSALTRETDIKGWYRTAAVLGVIFSEMNRHETQVLQEKVYRNIHASLSDEQLDGIQINFYCFPDDGKPKKLGPANNNFTFYPDVPKKERSNRVSLGIKRTIDILGSIMGILIFFPFFILIPICIKLTSRGPVFFRQARVGQYEKPFQFLKFRSMYEGNDPSVHREYIYNLISQKPSGDVVNTGAGEKVFKMKNDKRVTPLGKILRKTSLDELPQFFNVLKGEMSLTGPRPPIPYELEKYDIWHRRRVLEVKPGITGLWQVVGRSSTTFDEMVRLDLQYAANWSLWLDIKILLKTPWVVVAGRGAY